MSKGDKKAYETMFRRFYPKVHRFVAMLLKNEDDADDVSQLIFLKVWNKREKFADIQNFDSYLFILAKYTLQITMRKKDSTATLIARNTRFFPIVQRGLCDFDFITNTAKASAVGGSYSFKSTSAKMNRICMTHALVTEGVNPVTAANRMSAGIPINAVSPRFLPESRKIIENRIETWRPETAMIWLMPLTLKEVFVS